MSSTINEMNRTIPKFKEGDMFKITDSYPKIYYFVIVDARHSSEDTYKVNGGWNDQLKYTATHRWLPVTEQAEIDIGLQKIVEISMGLRERGT